MVESYIYILRVCQIIGFGQDVFRFKLYLIVYIFISQKDFSKDFRLTT